MNCNDTRKLFSEAFDSRLDTEALMRFQTHTGSCASCAEEYAGYESLFAAVAALPEIENDLPVPYPETARAFKKPDLLVTPLQRFVRVAMLLLVLSGIGWLAFDAGRREGKATEDPEQAVAALDPSKIVLPDVSAQRQLRLVDDRARSYGTVLEAGPYFADPTMIRLVDDAGRGLRDSCQELVTLEPQKLGTFAVELRRTAMRLDSLSLEVEDILNDAQSTDMRLKRSRDLVRVRGLERLRRPIRTFVVNAPETDLPAPVDGDVYSITLAGINQLARRDAQGAMIFLSQAREFPGFKESKVSEFAAGLNVFIESKLVGSRPFPSGHPGLPQGFVEVLQEDLVAPEGAWITGTADNEVRFMTGGLSRGSHRIILKSRTGPKQSSVEIKLEKAAPPSPSPNNRKL